MKILVFDNYDSFTYNLVQMIKEQSNATVEVFRNDEISLEAIKAYDKILLSPGPGIPSESGLLLPLIKTYAATKSILGVCLGQQAIAEAFGGSLTNLSKVYPPRRNVRDALPVLLTSLESICCGFRQYAKIPRRKKFRLALSNIACGVCYKEHKATVHLLAMIPVPELEQPHI